jgi:hypothetical protein
MRGDSSGYRAGAGPQARPVGCPVTWTADSDPFADHDIASFDDDGSDSWGRSKVDKWPGRPVSSTAAWRLRLGPRRDSPGVYYCNANPANDNQEWYYFDATGNSDYAFVNYKSSLCLDVSGWASNGSDLAPNLPLTLYDCYNSSWQNRGYDDHLWDVFQT